MQNSHLNKMRLKRYLKDKETRKIKKNIKESDNFFDKDAIKILKKLKIPFVKGEPKWRDEADLIEISFDQVLSGNYMLGIKNYTVGTSWKDFKDFSKFFKTEDELMKKTKNALNRYKKQGFTFHIHVSSMLNNIIFAYRKKQVK